MINRKENKQILDKLYSLSKKSLVALLVLSVLMSGILYQVFQYKVLYWEALFVALLLLRLYFAYQYTNNYASHSLRTWFNIFILLAYINSFFIAIYALYLVATLDVVYMFFVVISLFGLLSGASMSLAADYKLFLNYMYIIYVGVFLGLIFSSTEQNIILIIMFIIFYFLQKSMARQNYLNERTINSLEKQQDFFKSFFKEAPVAIFTYNENLEIIDCNVEVEKLFKKTKEELVRFDLNLLGNSRYISTLKESIVSDSKSFSGLFNMPDNEIYIEAKTFPFFHNTPDKHSMVCMVEDKTKEYLALQKLEKLVSLDSLTGLLNRRGFYDYINSVISDKRHKSFYSILFYLDLNQFKAINDSLGHEVGDKVLLAVSNRLKGIFNGETIIGRLGGDEFVVFFPFISDCLVESKIEVTAYANKIKKLFNETFLINKIKLNINASIGIVFIEPNYKNTKEIIRHADLAMYQGKRNNKNISYYNSSLDKKQKELFLLQQDLSNAIKYTQMAIYLQPIVNLSDQKIYAAELLIRWNHPKLGLLLPIDFIPLAIKGGYLSDITWWIIEEICIQLKQWKENKQWHLNYISININAKQLKEEKFSHYFLYLLDKYDIPTSDIILEITERSLIDDFDNTQEVIDILRKKGVRCAIDDFGIGYSSLSYLKRLSFDILKIDKEFINGISENSNELELMSTIINIGHQFKYEIVVEGIETKEQKELLLSLSHKLKYQGFYFSKPLPLKVFSEKFLT